MYVFVLTSFRKQCIILKVINGLFFSADFDICKKEETSLCLYLGYVTLLLLQGYLARSLISGNF